MRRREFIGIVGGVVAWPLGVRAQQPAMPVVGHLANGPEEVNDNQAQITAFRQGLKETGYIEGQNVSVEYRWNVGQYDQAARLAAELVQRQVAVIATATPACALAAKAATTTIPIVFSTGADPVKQGLVASLNRPGGNITGNSTLINALGTKRLELFHALLPKADVIGILVNPANPYSHFEVEDYQDAARALHLHVPVLNASDTSGIEVAFTELLRRHIDTIIVAADAFFNYKRDLFIALAARQRVSAIYSRREFVDAGGLMSYGTSLLEMFRQQGAYVGRILKGEKPGDLPVVLPRKFDLVINLKTAKALDLDVPSNLLALADEVIE